MEDLESILWRLYTQGRTGIDEKELRILVLAGVATPDGALTSKGLPMVLARDLGRREK